MMLKNYIVKARPLQLLSGKQLPFAKKSLSLMTFVFLIALMLIPTFTEKVYAQFNANYQPVVFTAANRIQKVGNGQSNGNIVLYTNVVTIGGQPFDCIVTTVNVTGGSFTLPGGAAAGSTPHDLAGSATGITGNNDNFFSPMFNWNAGGGYCLFEFQFILGGSYNNTTNTGVNVYLQNIYLNTYDIDGNGSSNSNQYAEFGGFATSQYGSNITPTYNTLTDLTKFRSNTIENTPAITADANRIKVSYSIFSKLDISVGGDNGPAYYFLDFSFGPLWTIEPPLNTAPVVDLNTNTTGLNNIALNYCGGYVKFTEGGMNVSNSVNSINEITITIPSAQIKDGNNELLVYNSGSPTTSNFSWGFTSTSTQNVTIAGIPVKVTRSIDNANNLNNKVITIEKVNTPLIFSMAEADAIMDALYYTNTATTRTVGFRNFDVKIREAAFVSGSALFLVDVANCTADLSVQKTVNNAAPA